jgi:hypothetical protein
MGMSSPLVITRSISADDNFPNLRDGDFDDLQVSFEYVDPLFAVEQRPFAIVAQRTAGSGTEHAGPRPDQDCWPEPRPQNGRASARQSGEPRSVSMLTKSTN